ncbi:MAG: GntR family transcriptional regulator [Bacillota bacterium]
MENKTGENKQKTVTEQLLIQIRKQIVDGSFKSNDQIPTELELAKQYNISRTSVREALKTLNYLGIVESHTSRGTRITNKNRIIEEAAAWSVILNADDMRDVFALGTALDTQVSIIIIKGLLHNPNAYRHFCSEIDEILIRLSEAAFISDIDDFTTAFSDFFRALYAFTRNMVFISLNECIDTIVGKRVCAAYRTMGVLFNVADFLISAWEAIRHCDMTNCIEIFQDYGAFAYDVVLQYEEHMENQPQ